MRRPFVALLAEDRGAAGWLVVPVSPFTVQPGAEYTYTFPAVLLVMFRTKPGSPSSSTFRASTVNRRLSSSATTTWSIAMVEPLDAALEALQLAEDEEAEEAEADSAEAEAAEADAAAAESLRAWPFWNVSFEPFCSMVSLLSAIFISIF